MLLQDPGVMVTNDGFLTLARLPHVSVGIQNSIASSGPPFSLTYLYLLLYGLRDAYVFKWFNMNQLTCKPIFFAFVLFLIYLFLCEYPLGVVHS